MNFDGYIENAKTGERTEFPADVLMAFAGDGRRAPRQKRGQKTPETAGGIEPLLSIVEAAKKFGLPRRRIDEAINGGELAFYQFGERARKLKASDISAWLEKKRACFPRFGGGAE